VRKGSAAGPLHSGRTLFEAVYHLRTPCSLLHLREWQLDVTSVPSQGGQVYPYRCIPREQHREADMRRTANSEGVVRALLESDWGHTHAVARSTGLNRETVSRVLRRLADEGLAVVRSSGPRREYALTDAGRRLADEWQLLPDPSQPARYRRRRINTRGMPA
jgi:predicted transcriptional regulator